MSSKFISLKLQEVPLILVFQDLENKSKWMSPIPSETHSLYTREKQCSLCMGFMVRQWSPCQPKAPIWQKSPYWILSFFCYAIKPFYAFIKLVIINARWHLRIPLSLLWKILPQTDLQSSPLYLPLLRGWVSGTWDGSHLTLMPEWAAFTPNPCPEPEFTETNSAILTDGSNCPKAGSLDTSGKQDGSP